MRRRLPGPPRSAYFVSDKRQYKDNVPVSLNSLNVAPELRPVHAGRVSVYMNLNRRVATILVHWAAAVHGFSEGRNSCQDRGDSEDCFHFSIPCFRSPLLSFPVSQ